MISHDEITGSETYSLAERRAFMKLPLEERRKILENQAERMAEYYEQHAAADDREHWQGGDIVDYKSDQRGLGSGIT
jgi:hypothetical protein